MDQIKETILKKFVELGWIVKSDLFCGSMTVMYPVETFRGKSYASAMMFTDKEGTLYLKGVFTTHGDNALSSCNAYFSLDDGLNEVNSKISFWESKVQDHLS